MSETLLAIGYAVGAIAVGVLALGAAGALVLRWRLARANRVSPTVKSHAPLSWLWSPATPARLHRRLRGAVRLTDAGAARNSAEAPSLSVESLRRELEVMAARLDDQLLVAARHPAEARRRLLPGLQTQVEAVESLAIRLSHLNRPIGGSGAPSSVAPVVGEGPLGDLSERVDALEAAHAELAHVDRAHGLARGAGALPAPAPASAPVAAPVAAAGAAAAAPAGPAAVTAEATQVRGRLEGPSSWT